MTNSDERPLTPPSLVAVHQHPADLVLALLDSRPPVPMTVLAARSLTVGRYRFAFHIIGESHWVQVEADQRPIWAEVLACVPISPSVCWVHHPFADLAPHRVGVGGYVAAIHFEIFSADARLEDLAPPHLEVRFPAVHGHTPFTRLWWGQQGKTVWWRTLHLYPEAAQVTAVWSESAFRVSSEP
jgi:hypothetical protein